MKKFFNFVAITIVIIITIWVLASIADVNLHNQLNNNYGNFAPWNLFTLIRVLLQ